MGRLYGVFVVNSKKTEFLIFSVDMKEHSLLYKIKARFNPFKIIIYVKIAI